MKSALRKDLEPVSGSFVIKELTEPYFDPNWHFHPHYQLFLVEQGTGTRFIGDSIQSFDEGDMVFLGPNLPHLWRSDQRYYEREANLMTKGIVIYFSEGFLGDAFFDRPEMVFLRQLLTYSRRGLEWLGETRTQIEKAMKEMLDQAVTFDRVLSLLTLLNQLSHSTEYRFITSEGYSNTVKPSETKRMQVIHNYILDNYQQVIQLETLADLIGMSPSAFCRYFKTHTNKTFSEFISEVRVGQACKLLIDGNLNVTEVSYECGFRTLSNFNRQFKDVTGQTPSQYKKSYLELL
ncbi:AraC family transcriptional regulator [Tellurirhabdus bombi]|uniref:AraC family transcriptional regulator n=1 Tax=Tellurirhabdus bombi TaxID=2907205 RepID=UPI001F228631|nr:AraC family transcriptional regulator [Tellurirhabdus bombi]